ncbi:hypothetical protein niasHS_016723 [Heterodera schachtii]|uniref:OTU domain-containing protein n=1 Tax=Heterodera schachtii TaxID=97005 RepID=A0ABD2HUS8_HETSC
MHNTKRIISEFINYADMIEFMIVNEGKLGDSNSINFNSLPLALPDPPNDLIKETIAKPNDLPKSKIEKPFNVPKTIISKPNDVPKQKIAKKKASTNDGGQKKKKIEVTWPSSPNGVPIEYELYWGKDILPLKPGHFGTEFDFFSDKHANSQQSTVASTTKNKKPKKVPERQLKHSKSMAEFRTMQNANESTIASQEFNLNRNIKAKKINVYGDGNCLFRSFAVSLYGDDDGKAHKKLRKAAAESLIQFEQDPARSSEDKDLMKAKICVNLSEGDSMHNYHDSIAEYATNYVSKNRNYAGVAESHALAIHLNRNVALIDSIKHSVLVVHPDFTQTKYDNITSDKYKQIWQLVDNPIVIWHDGNDHFNSICLKKKSSFWNWK